MKAFLSVMLLVILTGCVPTVTETPSLHEIVLFSNGQDLNKRLSYFYGDPQGIIIAGQERQLSTGSSDAAFQVENALLIDGAENLSQTLDKLSPPPTRVQRIPLTTEVQLEVGENVSEVLYFDGNKWFTVAVDAKSGFVTTLAPRERINGLVGVAELTREEAAMLMRELEPRGPLAVTVIPDSRVPARRVDGLNEYLISTFYVQLTLPTDVAAYNPPSRDLIWEVIAQGNQAVGFDQEEYLFISSQQQFLSTWNRAYGSQLSVPSLPTIDFDRETLVAVFLGEKPSGGYSIEVQDVSLEDGDIYINMQKTEPAPGLITTQALTSPWVFVRVLRGDIDAAWFRSTDSSELFAVARRSDGF